MKDINGDVLNIGDYVLYSEMPYSNYADSLCLIILHNGIIKLQSIVNNKHTNGLIEYINYLEPLDNCINIEYCNTRKDLEKVTFDGNEPLIFMKNNYPKGVR